MEFEEAGSSLTDNIGDKIREDFSSPFFMGLQ